MCLEFEKVWIRTKTISYWLSTPGEYNSWIWIKSYRKRGQRRGQAIASSFRCKWSDQWDKVEQWDLWYVSRLFDKWDLLKWNWRPSRFQIYDKNRRRSWIFHNSGSTKLPNHPMFFEAGQLYSRVYWKPNRHGRDDAIWDILHESYRTGSKLQLLHRML